MPAKTLNEMIIDMLGAPDPSEPVSLQFDNRMAELKWDSYTHDMLAGWFKDGFINLMGSGLDALKPCVDAWSWLVPPSDDRTVIGRNAYGAIAFGDGMNALQSHISIVDPVTLKLYRSIDFVGFFGRWIASRDIPSFQDDSVYQEWRRKGRQRLPLHEILGIKAALPLDGKMELANFERVNILDYYQSTAEVYARSLTKERAPKARPTKKRSRPRR